MDSDRMVSVIIPCHDDGEYLRTSVHSVLDQDYENFEIVIVNDGSKDPQTLNVLSSFSDDKITVISQANRGLPAARNAGIKASKGYYILPVDADDKIPKTSISTHVRKFSEDRDSAIVYGNYNTFGIENRVVITGIFNPYRILFSNYMPVSSMYTREAWERVGGYTEEMMGFEDWEFWIKLVEADFRFSKVNAVTFFYRIREDSMFTRHKSKFGRIVKQIRSLHPRLYTRENIRALRRENRITWLEDAVYHLPVLVRFRLGKLFFRKYVKYINQLGLYRDQ